MTNKKRAKPSFYFICFEVTQIPYTKLIAILAPKNRCHLPSVKFCSATACQSKEINAEKLLNNNETTNRIIKNVKEICTAFFQKIPVFNFSKNVIISVFHYCDDDHDLSSFLTPFFYQKKFVGQRPSD